MPQWINEWIQYRKWQQLKKKENWKTFNENHQANSWKETNISSIMSQLRHQIERKEGKKTAKSIENNCNRTEIGRNYWNET